MVQQFDSDEDRPPMTGDDISKAIHTACKKVLSRFYGYVEYEDLHQEALLAQIEHPRTFGKWADNGQAFFYHREITRRLNIYAQKQRAAALGYKPEDLFFYSKRVLRELVPAILQSWKTGQLFELEYRDRSLWMDVERGLNQLHVSDMQIIRWAFDDESRGNATVATKLGLSETAAASRVDRVLGHLQDQLGGGSPYQTRRVLSNAASQAATRNQWNGEG